MQSYLWLKSATLYRELKQYFACKSAIDEAKKCLGPLVKIYREKMPLKLEVYKSTMERAQSSSSIDNRDVFTDIKWNTCPSDIRNLISDIIYEVGFLNMY